MIKQSTAFEVYSVVFWMPHEKILTTKKHVILMSLNNTEVCFETYLN